MDFLISFVSFFWLIRTFKFVLFWIYLWQLKEYHIGRFVDHFRTEKGKSLVFNKSLFIKVFFLFILLYSLILQNSPDDPSDPWLLPGLLGFFGLFVVYAIEAIKTSKDFITRDIKKPVFTSKVTLLFSATIVIIIAFFAAISKNILNAPLALVIFDIFTPIIVSAVVLLFQPFFVAARNNILKKAKEKIKKFKNLTVIGITGSYGKTSTKEFLTTILSAKFNVLSTHEHQNSEIGISQCILNDLTDKHQIFIVEMGSYKKGGINLLCDIIKPKIGIVTGVNEQHLALFGSLYNLLSAEGGRELAENLPKDGLIVLNGDNKYCLDLYKKVNTLGEARGELKKKLYSLNRNKIDSDIWAEDVAIKENSISFITISKQKEMVSFNVNVLGKQNVQNLLGAILVAKELGMGFDKISDACKNIRQEQAGITLQNGIYGINIIDSSYSSNPNGVMADLDYLDVFSQKKVIVMPCLIELGPKSAEIHRQIGKKIAEICDLAIIATRDKFEDLKKGAMQNGMAQDKIMFSDNPKDIFTTMTTFCKEGDAILLEGGRPKELIKLLHVK